MAIERLALQAMATRFELVFEGERAAGEAALELIAECEARLSLFRTDSLIARINREACERPVQLDPETFELLQACSSLREATAGTFDVCVEPRMRALGFHPGPGHDQLGSYALDASTRSVRFTRPSTALDLGGIAKGHALDLAVACLREQGVECALIHGGTSSVVALGAPPGRRGWRVELAHASDAPVVELRDEALSVSAPHGRVVELGAQRLGHVLDPSSGVPVPLGSTAAVVHASARTAEAWSKALLVHAARGTDPRVPDDVRVVSRGPRP